MSDVRARTELDELRDTVAVMRELGVVRWNGIELGPAPIVTRPVTVLPLEERIKRENEQRMNTMFAATGTRPTSLTPKSPDADKPRAVVTRSKGAETTDGPRTSREG